MFGDTVAAVSTPRGKGGVALLRVSGDKAIEISAKVFVMNNRNLNNIPSNTAVYGHIVMLESDGGRFVFDDGIAVVYRAPRSFTGEDTVEITCHGGILVTETVLSALLAAGATPAGPGEFTKRAFLNGKLSLSSAEALGNLLDAVTQQQIKLSHSGLNGRLSNQTDKIYSQLRSVLASVFVRIDYPDEDLADMSTDEMISALSESYDEIHKLASTYKTGHAVTEGVKTVIAGKANAGKSSLYNQIVGRDAAIVTDVAGTTRDILEQTAGLGKVTLRLFDTAGIRETDDKVEKIGVERAVEALETAELVLAVIDSTDKIDSELYGMVQRLETLKASGVCVIAILNKTDCRDKQNAETVDYIKNKFENTVELSAASGSGMDLLTDLVEKLWTDGSINITNDAIIVNARQNSAVLRCADALKSAIGALKRGMPVDMCCTDIEIAMQAIGEVDGRAVSDDVVAEIFSKFCVGK